jgi:hypothetical protein
MDVVKSVCEVAADDNNITFDYVEAMQFAQHNLKPELMKFLLSSTYFDGKRPTRTRTVSTP